MAASTVAPDRHIELPYCPQQVRCGGCPLLPMPIAEQHQLKLARVADALCDALGCSALATPPQMVASHAEGYRRRVRMLVRQGGMLGYFNTEKSPQCLVLQPALRDAIAELAVAMQSQPEWAAEVAYVEVRAPDMCGRPAAYLHLAEGSIDKLASLRRALPQWLIGCQHTPVMPCQRVRLMGAYGYLPIDAFAQIHGATNHRLLAALVEGARERQLMEFCDLFAGSGNFAITLAAAGLSGHAVEWHPGAVRALRQAASEQALAVEAHAADALKMATAWAEGGRRFQWLVADPPRAGLKHGHAALAALASRYIALVCCRAEAIAADVARLCQHGFALERVLCFDMFPHTQHVEVLAWLRRVDG